MSLYTRELDDAVCAFAVKHYRPGGPLTWDDVRQIGRLAAWEALPKHRNEGKLTSFVFTAIQWRIADAYRRKVAPTMPQEAVTASLDATEHEPDHSDRVAGDANVRWLLSSLTPRERTLIRLVDVEGQRVTDVARLLGVSKGTVAASRHRALARLRRAA